MVPLSFYKTVACQRPLKDVSQRYSCCIYGSHFIEAGVDKVMDKVEYSSFELMFGLVVSLTE